MLRAAPSVSLRSACCPVLRTSCSYFVFFAVAALGAQVLTQLKQMGADKKEPLGETLRKAAKRALGGGIAGALAMIIQVIALMWMRTTIKCVRQPTRARTCVITRVICGAQLPARQGHVDARRTVCAVC